MSQPSTSEISVPNKPRDKSPFKYNPNDDCPLIRDLVKKRGIVKGRLSKFSNYLSSVANTTLSSQTRIDLKLRIQGAARLFDEFSDIQRQIEESVSDIDEQLTQRELMENRYYTLLSQAECLLNPSEVTDCSSKCSHHHKPAVKLPTISMPSFDGSYEHWLEFRDTFLSLVHNSNDLSNIEKFHYLKSSLKGSAELVINAVEFSSANYPVAWDLLLNRYNNSELLVHNHVMSLFTMQNLSKESPDLIRQLIDTVLKNLRALKMLDEPTDAWDTLVIYLILLRFNPITEQEWEQYKRAQGLTRNGDSKPKRKLKLDDMMNFLKDRADVLETLQVTHSKRSTDNKKHNTKNDKSKIHCNVSTNKPEGQQLHKSTKNKKLCLLCNANHPLYACQGFLDFNLDSKLKFIHEKKLCTNCLRSDHTIDNCRFGPCRLCHKKHNSLLHSDNHTNQSVALHVSHANEAPTAVATATGALPPSLTAPTAPAPSSAVEVTTIHANKAHINTSTHSPVMKPVLLSTALVEIVDNRKNYHLARALLDSGSERCFITQTLCNLIQAPVIQSTQEIRGVGNSITTSTQMCDIELKSRIHPYTTHLQCFILPNITSALPALSQSRESGQLKIPEHIVLADPHFNESQSIDILIGADIFWDLINSNKIRLPSGPFLLDTKLGWVISGPICSLTRYDRYIQCNFSQSIDSQLRKFWELEDMSAYRDTRTDEERSCEQHFVNTTTRNSDGRFKVRIPFKTSPDTLGETYTHAQRRFFALEKRLLRNPDYKKLYADFIHEYIRLGHMSRVDRVGKPNFFLPHHGVFREHSTTTKLRVVFDASAAASNDISLNEIQMVGPPIQGDLLSILLRFRQHKYTACADIEKMYRQCLIHEDQRDLQLILWRDDPSQSLDVYRLNTVTYGTASAPFLSCRCLKQLAADCTDHDVTRIINEDFYVDDMITGCDNKQQLLDVCKNVANILKLGCFPLRKWMFNFNIDDNESDLTKELSLGENVHSKTLGLGWHNINDIFYFDTQFNSYSNQLIITKRYIMSTISQIFDPLGLLSPMIIIAKILLQKLWLVKIGWDDEVPSDVKRTWDTFVSSLLILNNISVPRHVIGRDPASIELHIFTDASESAYGACIYVRTMNRDSSVSVRLCCSKSKVAPLNPVSIPRLELCGALLGARLFNKVRESLRCQFNHIVFWCDSTIVLGWLRMAPHLLKTFVQNRAAEIHEIAKELPWCHVSGKNNPADLVSRGVRLEDLQSSTLWWEGPEFLRQPDFDSSQATLGRFVAQSDLPEVKPAKTHAFLSTTDTSLFPFKRFSQFNRMQRTCAYVLRFIFNSRNRNNIRHGPLTVDELRNACITLVKLSQHESFPEECKLLGSNKSLKNKHHLSKLNIFADNDGILRVGGRIKLSSDFNFDKKHPVLISSNHWFVVLLFRHEHKRLQHAAPQALLYNIRESHWPVGGRNLAKRTVHECVTCTRLRGKSLSPIMGNLPQERITPSFPFLRTGVDYAGPVLVLNRKGRGSKLIKGYICLFICLVTRAIHLELVSDLSSNAYLLALKRFISRRGKPDEIMSDNGRNFVGLANEFSKFLSTCSDDLIEYATSQNIKFSFIPPYAPHFGGLWEAGVKSCKHHLLRVVGNAHLTFEEYSTVLTQIEAVLNSRPISPLSADPNDFLPLCPSHFLVGRLLTAPSTPQLTDVPAHRLTRYQRLEQLRQHFWIRWSKEYISEMQTRMKWRQHGRDLQPNTLVLIKEDNTPPLKWSLGRIISTVPGKDGISRVADIQTKSGVIRRAFPRICPLLNDGDDEKALDVGTYFQGRGHV